jgi:predicted Fe-Mo cluster-binding NifX family protein
MDTKPLVIAVSTNSADQHGPVSDRFARCNFFAIYHHKGNQYTFIENTAKNESGGAGAKAAKLLGDNNVNVVLVPEIGPKAFEALQAFEIEIYRYNKNDTVLDAIDELYAGKLPQLTTSTKHGEHK